jgi:hypothetical protein
MLSLTATLLAAQKQPVRTPAIRVNVTDQPLEFPRFDWTEIYTNLADNEHHHALGKMNNGNFVRARATATGQLYVQRIADPTNATQWQTWTLLEAAGTLKADTPIGLLSKPHTNLVRIFYVAADGYTIKNRESTDGATWAAAETVHAEAITSTVKGVTASASGGGDFCYWAIDKGGAAPDTYLAAKKKTAGVWGGYHQDTDARRNVTGIASDRASDGYSTIIVADGDPRRLAYKEYDENGAAWAGQADLLASSAGAPFVYHSPFFVERDTTSPMPRHLHIYVEQCTASPAYHRVFIAPTPRRAVLTELVPFSIDTRYGFKLTRSSTHWYLTNSQRAYSSPIYDAAAVGKRVELLTDALLNLEIRSTGVMKTTTATITLQNADGRYATAGEAGTYLALREGSQAAIQLGYVTSSGTERTYVEPFWIDQISFHEDKGEGYLVLECIDVWEQLDRRRVIHQRTFTGQTIAYILSRVLWRVLDATVTATGGLANTLPLYTWQPGQSFATIARELVRMSGGFLRFRTNQAAPNGGGFTSVTAEIAPYGAGTSAFSYGGASGHPLTAASHTKGGQVFNHVEVFGLGSLVGEALDYGEINTTWRHSTIKLVDRQIDTQAKADARAIAEMNAARVTGHYSWLEGPVNIGQETGDIVDVTDSRAGLVAAERTVLSRRVYFERRARHRFDQKLVLGDAE